MEVFVVIFAIRDKFTEDDNRLMIRSKPYEVERANRDDDDRQ